MERNIRKQFNGIVVSNANDKTITVEVTRYKKHRLYGKAVKQTKKFHVHDEDNQAKVGDKVRIMETRPLSKTKRFRLVKITEVAEKI